MNVKKIVEDWLKSHGYDGLCNLEVPCGCLLGDLAPCGGECEECRPGHREDVDENCECGCDGQGVKHWHVCIDKSGNADDQWQKHITEASEWLCDCGERCVPASAQWRWNGIDWEHHHGYPVGHVAAKRVPKNDCVVEAIKKATMDLNEAIYSGCSHAKLTTLVDALRVAVFVDGGWV